MKREDSTKYVKSVLEYMYLVSSNHYKFIRSLICLTDISSFFFFSSKNREMKLKNTRVSGICICSCFLLSVSIPAACCLQPEALINLCDNEDTPQTLVGV